MTQTTEAPSAASKPEHWQVLFERFDSAAMLWGSVEGNGLLYTLVMPSKTKYETARAAMLECLASLERERDEARRERDNPAYTTQDYHLLDRAHYATEDARRKAVDDADQLKEKLWRMRAGAREAGALDMRERAARKIKSLGESQFENCERLGFMDPETGARECSLEVNGRNCLCQDRDEFAEELATAISALDPKGDQP